MEREEEFNPISYLACERGTPWPSNF